MRSALPVARSALAVLARPGPAALAAAIAYTLLAVVRVTRLEADGSLLWIRSPWGPSGTAYFNYLADALLHGQLRLRQIPPSTHDLSVLGDQLFLYWGPMPALLLMPLIAIFGVGVSDVLPTIFAGAVNVALVAMLLASADRADLAPLSAPRRGLLVLFFALGTVHATLAPHACVWFTAQVVAFLFVALAYLAPLRLRGRGAYLATGAALAAAFLTRNHLLATGVWPVAWLLSGEGHRGEAHGGEVDEGGSPAGIRWRPSRETVVRLGLLATPVVLAALLMAAYNAARFGNPFDSGVAYHSMHPDFRTSYALYGTFHPHYLTRNLYWHLLAYPFPVDPGTSFLGGGLFWLSPVFLAAFPAILRSRKRWSTVALVASIVLVAGPIFFLMGTGWVQFGPRYSLDYTVPLLLLVAQGVASWPAAWLAALTLLSVAHYVTGTILLGRVI